MTDLRYRAPIIIPRMRSLAAEAVVEALMDKHRRVTGRPPDMGLPRPPVELHLFRHSQMPSGAPPGAIGSLLIMSWRNEFNFSGLTSGHPHSFQVDPSIGVYPPVPQPSLPDHYQRAQWASSQDPQFAGSGSYYTPEQGVLNVQTGSRRSTSRELAVPPQFNQSSSSQQQSNPFYDHTIYPGAQQWILDPNAPQPMYSPSSSPSDTGSPRFVDDGSPTGGSLSLSSGDVPSHPRIEDFLREELHLSPDQPIHLSSLPDPPPGVRPITTLKLLIATAIFGSPYKRLTLQEIFAEIEARYSWYRDQPADSRGTKAWQVRVPEFKADFGLLIFCCQGSIRHNLSLECIFVNDNRPIAEPGKGGYWSLTNASGYGQKRARKRRSKAQKEQSARVKSEDEEHTLDDDDYEDFSFDERQVGPSFGTQRRSRSSRSVTGRTMTNSPVSFDSSATPIFGQTSMPVTGHMRQLAPQPARMHSMPNLPGQSSGHQHPHRPATLPMAGYQHQHMGGEGRYPGYRGGDVVQDELMELDEDLRRTRPRRSGSGASSTERNRRRAFE
ncbi:hypothetical protein H0H81_007105 [Sphagnurus paluster]|uniref:Fork-head domain-containing protein n=1 Tax=Sphagnurus paluster TaxID=117069 RepID=A0A9P7FTD4_9AGAR|nr:hypothetical protein H0H81_007105 [Sphagnurus paluster]